MFQAIKSATQSALETFQGMMAAGLDKVKGTLEEFHKARPQLEELGYRVTATELCCAISPSVTVLLDRVRPPSDEAFQALLARKDTSQTARQVINLLRQTEKMIGAFDLQGQRCSSVALELGLPPRVRMIYTDVDNSTPATELIEIVE